MFAEIELPLIDYKLNKKDLIITPIAFTSFSFIENKQQLIIPKFKFSTFRE